MESSRASGAALHDDVNYQSALTLRGLLAAARRQSVWVAGTAGFVMVLTLLYAIRQRPIYEANTSLRLAEQQNAGTQPDFFAALTAQSNIETEVEILRSRQVAEDVVNALGLRARVFTPSRVDRNTLFRTLRTRNNAATGTYVVRRGADTFSVTAPNGSETRAVYGTPVVVDGVELETLRPEADGGKNIELSIGPGGPVAEGVRSALKVARPQQSAAIVVLSYRNIDPLLARDVVDAVAQAYITRRNEMQKQHARTGVKFLETQVEAIGAELHEAEAALEQFRRQHFVIDPEAQAGDAVKRTADLRAQREQLAAEQNELRLLLARARSTADSGVDWTVFVSSPSLAKNQALSGIVQQLSTAEAERTRLGTWRTAADPDVATLQHTIGLLRSRLVEIAASQLRSLDAQGQALDSALMRGDARLQRIPDVQLRFARLRRQVDMDGQLYTLLQTRLKESQIAEATELANIQVVDPALVPTTPVGPSRTMTLTFGAASGLLLGLLVALARESSDTRVRSRERFNN